MKTFLQCVSFTWWTLVSESSKTEDIESTDSTPLQEQTPASAETENQYRQLVSRAKDITAAGHVKEALSLYRLAADLQPSDKLSRKMERMEVYHI